MITPMPCVIFKSVSKSIPESYDVGWLIDGKEPRILVWGNTKDKDTAKLLSDNLVKERGERLVFLYNRQLESSEIRLGVLRISSEELDDILTGSDREILYQYP
jgi:hypothetical protein